MVKVTLPTGRLKITDASSLIYYDRRSKYSSSVSLSPRYILVKAQGPCRVNAEIVLAVFCYLVWFKFASITVLQSTSTSAAHWLRHWWRFALSHATHRAYTTLLQFVNVMNFPMVERSLHFSRNSVVIRVHILTVWASQVWWNESGCFQMQKADCLACSVYRSTEDKNSPEISRMTGSNYLVSRTWR